MSTRSVLSLLGAALLLSSASFARAETAQKLTDFTVHADSGAISAQGVKALKWDARRGRWGLTLNLDQPDGRDTQLNDIQAGAYFRVTPSLRIGGAVALGEQPVIPAYKKTGPQDAAPRVRLETAFKF